MKYYVEFLAIEKITFLYNLPVLYTSVNKKTQTVHQHLSRGVDGRFESGVDLVKLLVVQN